MITLWILSFPTMGCFYLFVLWVGWIDVSLGIWGWIGYAITVCVSSDSQGLSVQGEGTVANEQVTLSLATAHAMTLFFWSKDLDPE
jgi:solute carrier family 41